MGMSAPRGCLAPGCAALVRGRPRCVEHTRQREEEKGSAHARGYGARWRAYRLCFLAEHPLCDQCLDDGQVTAATVVDHIQDHKGDQELFWDPDNHRALCRQHHDVRVDAGDFGR